jgi:hypothetical protein
MIISMMLVLLHSFPFPSPVLALEQQQGNKMAVGSSRISRETTKAKNNKNNKNETLPNKKAKNKNKSSSSSSSSKKKDNKSKRRRRRRGLRKSI